MPLIQLELGRPIDFDLNKEKRQEQSAPLIQLELGPSTHWTIFNAADIRQEIFCFQICGDDCLFYSKQVVMSVFDAPKLCTNSQTSKGGKSADRLLSSCKRKVLRAISFPN